MTSYSVDAMHFVSSRPASTSVIAEETIEGKSIPVVQPREGRQTYVMSGADVLRACASSLVVRTLACGMSSSMKGIL